MTTTFPPPVDGPYSSLPVQGLAIDDAATQAALAAMQRQGRLPILVSVGGTALLTAAVVLSNRFEQRLLGPLILFAFVAGFVLLAALMTHPLRRRGFTRARTLLGLSSWQLVELLMVKGSPVDPTKPIVVVLDPETGQPVGTWLGDWIGRTRWPRWKTRTWAYIAVGPDGDRAIIAPPDRSRVMSIEHGRGTAAIHEWAWDMTRDAWSFPSPGRVAVSRWAAPGARHGRLGAVHEPDGPKHWPNRPMHRRAQIGIVATLFVVGVVLSAHAVYRDRADPAHRQELLERGSRSSADVTNVYRGRSCCQATVVIVDGDAAGWEVRVSVPGSTSLHEGDRVQVVYNPNNPGDLAIVSEELDDNWGGVIGFWCMTAVVIVRFVWRDRRRREGQLAPPGS
jgi:hypothetical protein